LHDDHQVWKRKLKSVSTSMCSWNHIWSHGVPGEDPSVISWNLSSLVLVRIPT
jgi:hypothetical protein